MDILDAQLHIGPGQIDTMLEAMDSLGIRSALIDEFWGFRMNKLSEQVEPGYGLANGAWRAVYPVAELASILHPERFAFFVRVDRNDPELESVMRVIAGSPHARAFRILPLRTPEEAHAFVSGGYGKVFELAQDLGLPMCLHIPGHVEHLAQYLRRFPKLQFVVDHIGLIMGLPPAGRSPQDEEQVRDPAYFDEVLKLAEHPNVAIKWSHVPLNFGLTKYPFAASRPYLRRAIGAFGVDRLMWASDKTVAPGQTWSNLLDFLRYDPELSVAEKEAILGRTARRIFNWPLA
jgi:predicted TIM-barrel fold metal-dependent hydrolase